MGHSTHELDEFVALLERHGIRCLVDVRVHPGSRRMPHFNQGTLAHELPQSGIDYEHLRALGGRRRPAPGSPNAGWENEAFRGYADHMRGREFLEGLDALERLARERPTAIMCAEALWWRCHRRLVSDALLVRGWRVLHARPKAQLDEHSLTPFAVVAGGRIEYLSTQSSLDV